ncbi:MAG TPA: T9SS type A sorting domain-containing protein [Cyclobacteriaceae bacterium]
MFCISAVLFGSVFLSSILLHGQDFSDLTKIGIGENEQIAEVIDSKTDRLGNTYMIGSYYSKLILGDKTYNGPDYIYNNFFVAKFDRSGNVVWSDDIYGFRAASSDLSRLSLDKDGNIYIRGSLNREIFFTTSEKLSLPVTTNFGPSEAFLCKYRPDGTVDWARFIYGEHAVNEDGQILVEGMLHQGFATSNQWQNFRNTRAPDTLRCYDRSTKFEFKAKNPWEYIYEINTTFPRLSALGKDFLVRGMSNENFVISKLDPITKTFSSIVSIVLPTPVSSFDYNNGKICFLGLFRSGEGRLQFGGISVEASNPNDTDHYGEGYIVQYNISTNQFEWGKFMDKSYYIDRLLVKISDTGNVITSTREVGVSRPYYFRAYDATGNFLWEQTATAVTQSVKQIALDRYENVYVTGWVGNGVFDYADFGSLRFRYDYTVGYLARIQVSSCQPIAANASATICAGEKFTLGNKTYSTSGTYTDTIKRVMGCDSVVTLQLTVRPQSLAQFSATICSGETYSFRNKIYNTTGIFGDTLTNIHGCDSIVALTLTVLPQEPKTELFATICHGETYLVGDQVYNSTGVFEHTLTTIHGCDSIVSLQLTVRPKILTEFTATICEGEFYAFRDKSYGEEGTYTDTLQSVTGCDSLVSLQLNVKSVEAAIEILGNELKALPELAEYRWTNCQGDDFEFNIQTITPTASGDYNVIVTLDGCTAQSECIQYTLLVLEIEDESEDDLSITQTHDQMILTSKRGLRVVSTVSIYDIGGRSLIKLSNDAQDTIFIPSGQLPPGVYVIHLTGRNYFNVTRVVK